MLSPSLDVTLNFSPASSPSGRRNLQVLDITSVQVQEIVALAVVNALFPKQDALSAPVPSVTVTPTGNPGELKVSILSLETLEGTPASPSNLLVAVQSPSFTQEVGTYVGTPVVVTATAIVREIVPQPSPPPLSPPSPPSPPPIDPGMLDVGDPTLGNALGVSGIGTEVTFVLVIGIFMAVAVLGCAGFYYCGRRNGKAIGLGRMAIRSVSSKKNDDPYPTIAREDTTDSQPSRNPPPPMTSSTTFPSMMNVPAALTPQQVVGMAVELGMAVERQQSWLQEELRNSPRGSPRGEAPVPPFFGTANQETMQRVQSLSLSRQASTEGKPMSRQVSTEELSERLDQVKAALDDVRSMAEGLASRDNPRSPATLDSDGTRTEHI